MTYRKKKRERESMRRSVCERVRGRQKEIERGGEIERERETVMR